MSEEIKMTRKEVEARLEILREQISKRVKERNRLTKVLKAGIFLEPPQPDFSKICEAVRRKEAGKPIVGGEYSEIVKSLPDSQDAAKRRRVSGGGPAVGRKIVRKITRGCKGFEHPDFLNNSNS